MEYGQNIKQIRINKGIKACYVAQKLGLTPAGYSGIERGRSRLTAKYAQQIANILAVDVKDIFFNQNISETLNSSLEDWVEQSTLNHEVSTVSFA